MVVRDHPALSLSRQCRLLSLGRSSLYYTPKGEGAETLVLMRRIAAEKARMFKAGTIRKPRNLTNGETLTKPFEIPLSWHWCRLDSIGAIVGGGTPSSAVNENFTEPGKGVSWLTPADLGGHSQRYIERGSRDLSEKGLNSSSAILMPAGTVLFTSRAPIGYVAIASNPVSTNQGFKSIVPYLGESSRFIAIAMLAFAPEINAKAPGTTFKEVSGKIVSGISFPLPPLAEQHRIVAKVDELMALCDRLEAARAAREERRDRLTAAGLARLVATDPGAATFRAHARFAVDALTALTARTDQVKRLRQTVLNLAVRGRLVEQDPADEPASHLVKRIMKEHKGLEQRKKLRKKKTLEPITGDQEPFPIPHSWKWSRLGDLFHLVTDGAHHTPKFTDVGMPFLSVKNVSSGTIKFEGARFISEEQHRNLCKRCRPERGDILLTKVGTTGIAVPVNTDCEFSIFVSVALLKFSVNNLSQDFLCYLINSPFVRRQSSENTQAIGNQNLVLRLIKNFALPIPPLAEQHRIVAKVHELMALCDRLEANLAVAGDIRHRLLEAILREAVAPNQDELESMK